MSKKREIVFVKMLDATFIQKDIPILEEFAKVEEVYYKNSKGIGFAFAWFTSIFTFIKLFRKASDVYIWFADYHAFLPVFLSKFFKVKSYINIAGYDAAHIPELNYGAYTNPLRSFCTKYAIRNADYILPVADNLKKKLDKLIGPIKTTSVTIPFGFESKNWFCDTPKEDVVVTVSIFETERRLKIKGLDFFIEVAKAMPDTKFIIVGSTPKGEELIEKPDNLVLLPRTPQKELRAIYSKAKIYAQFSISEGLPNAVIESMLCECIPIGTDVGGIPDIIGDSGYVLEKRKVEDAVVSIKKALKDSELGKSARKRALQEYPYDKRGKMLKELFEV